MIFKIWRVRGDSMSPEIQEGDFVVVSKIPFLIDLSVGDRIVFHHPKYGILIKRIDKLDPHHQLYWLVGTHPESLDSHKIGPIREDQIYGKVIWHIRRS
ncbi:MAG: S24/S26 family peptidase [Anaerolineales bacterium]